jgi:AAA domain
MRVGISGTHGTGKTTLAQALCARLPGHVAADEPYYLLEAEGYEFGFPPSAEDYRALLACSVRSLSSPPLRKPHFNHWYLFRGAARFSPEMS